MFEADKGLQATIERLVADVNALKGKGITDIIEGDNISIDKKNPRKPKISSTGSGSKIDSIVAGDNITVDDTDPLNPIVSVQDITLSGEVTGSTSLSAIDKTAITNKTTETIVGTDYVLFGDTSDGDNLKKGLVSDIVALSGGGSLSSLTSATATNVINNGNFKQEWQWNTHTSGSAIKLSSALNTAHTPVTGSAVLDVSLSNSIIPNFPGGINYAAKFVNTYYATGGSNIAIAGYFETGDPAGILNSAVYSKGNIRIAPSSGRLYFGNYSRISGADGALSFSPCQSHARDNGGYSYGMEAGYTISVIRNLSSQPYYNWQTSYLYKDISTSRQVIAFGVDTDLRTTVGVGTSYGWIERSADKLMFAAQAGLSSSSAITPNYLLTLYGTNNNVGIGTTSPVTSAALDITSTTSGFLPPRMTATQASAISSPAKGLILYATDTNGTFTSAGLWMYNGTIWKLILAE